MFKFLAIKIAHNSTIPALAGNGDLRSLQDLITAEKNVILSLQRLSADFEKSSEALRTWGVREGDDLGDTLTASANILTHFSSALSQYASHGRRTRAQLKAIRTREEALDDLKQRRRTVLLNADATERKLSKMSPEHKNFEQQQDTLNHLWDEIRSLNGDIMSEEASLSDFKRTETKTMMSLKYGGLLECCEKGIIAGEYGKLVIAEIPEQTTPPGVPRSIYQGQRRTDELVAEANRCVSDVVLSTTAPMRTPNQEYFTQVQAGDASAWAQDDAQAPGSTNSSRFLSPPQDLGEGRFIEPSSSSIPFPMPSVPHETRDGPKRRSIDDFGTAVWDSPGATESRFHTYPLRIGPSTDADISGDDLLHSRHKAGTPFSALTTIGTDVRAGENLPAPPSYEDRELEELHHHPRRDRRLESSYDDIQASRRHSAYLKGPPRLPRREPKAAVKEMLDCLDERWADRPGSHNQSYNNNHGAYHAVQEDHEDPEYHEDLEYTRLRALAQEEAQKRATCFEASKAAYSNREGAKAKELSTEGKEHGILMEQYNERAANLVFRQNNAHRPPTEIDLHGLHVKEASQKVEEAILKCQQMKLDHLVIIAGKGLHSPGQIAKLKPAITELVNKFQVAVEPNKPNPGCLYVEFGKGPSDLSWSDRWVA